MESSCVRHTDIPSTSKLFADLVYEFDRVSSFYTPRPSTREAWAAAAAQVRFPESRRTALVAALRAQNGGSALLDLLARPGTVAVTTGQQVGLFSGPCYTVYKALTASKLARYLTDRGIPAVPVFWLATEDHDFAEVNHCWSFEPEHRPVPLHLDGVGPTPGPVGSIVLEKVPQTELRASLESFPFGGEVAAMVEETYVAGRTLGKAFRDLLGRLLSGHEILFLDPMQPDVRSIAAPMLRDTLEAAPELTEQLLARNRELEASGYHAQVHVEPDTSLFFLLEHGRRLALRRKEGEYAAGERRISTAELASRAEHLSPNALLRPVLQDYILPTLAYVGGAAEMAYLAQSEVLYRSLLSRMPVGVPRSAFTILDARSAKLVKRYGLTAQSFFHGLEPLEQHISARLIPEELNEVYRAVTGDVGKQIDSLHHMLSRFDATLAASLDKSRSKILYQLSKNERKAAREALRRNQRAGADAAYLQRLVYPDKHLQERFYTILPFLARHGLDLVDRLYENVHLDCPDHILLAA